MDENITDKHEGCGIPKLSRHSHTIDAITKIENLLGRAGDLFNSIDSGVRQALLNYHAEHFTLQASLRWGLQAAKEIKEDWSNVAAGISCEANAGDSEDDMNGKAKNCKLCGANMVWENPTIKGYFHESSCNTDDWHICDDCMAEHCNQTNCLVCEYGTYPDCRFIDLKRHGAKEE